MKNKLSGAIILLVSSFYLSACLPHAIFTGAAASGLEFAKDRSAGETIDDIKIATKIKAQLLSKHFKHLYTKVHVEVVQGRVLLTGLILKHEDVVKVLEIVWAQPGVHEVINELKIDKNSNRFNIIQYTRDSMITAQIKSKLIINRNDIKFINYNIITINDIVYIFGIARSEEELEKVTMIAANIHGVEKVISHAKIQVPAQKIMPNNDKHDSKSKDDLLIDGGVASDDDVKSIEDQDITGEEIIDDSEIMDELDNNL